MKTILLDGDIVAYKFAAKAEERIKWGDGCETVNVLKSKEDVCHSVQEYILAIQKKLKADVVIACISDDNNFRKAVLSSYKSNRTTPKPILLPEIKDWLMVSYSGYKKPYLEADDVMGILATHPTLIKGDKIIVSEDKDMRTLPATIYNPMKDELFTVTEAEADRYHLMQTLTGDTTDGYKGCPGIGKVKADKYLDELCEWTTVVATYHCKGLTEADALVQARVAKILRYYDYDYENKQPILWLPKNPI